MDPSVVEASTWIDEGVLRGLITALTMLVYGGIFWWAYRRGNRERFDADALMPFMDDDLPPVPVPPMAGRDER